MINQLVSAAVLVQLLDRPFTLEDLCANYPAVRAGENPTAAAGSLLADLQHMKYVTSIKTSGTKSTCEITEIGRELVRSVAADWAHILESVDIGMWSKLYRTDSNPIVGIAVESGFVWLSGPVYQLTTAGRELLHEARQNTVTPADEYLVIQRVASFLVDCGLSSLSDRDLHDKARGLVEHLVQAYGKKHGVLTRMATALKDPR